MKIVGLQKRVVTVYEIHIESPSGIMAVEVSQSDYEKLMSQYGVELLPNTPDALEETFEEIEDDGTGEAVVQSFEAEEKKEFVGFLNDSIAIPSI